MNSERKTEYMPDYVSPPGSTLAEVMENLGISQQELADRSGRSRKTINEIVQGKSPITAETAIQFERVLGIPAHFWVARESKYRAWLAKQEEEKRLENEPSFVKNFPLSKMMALGWIPSVNDAVEQARCLLNYFGVASPDKIQMTEAIAFRRSEKFVSDAWSLAAWLRQGEIQAKKIDAAPYDRDKFLAVLKKARSWTVLDPDEFVPRLVSSCATVGVYVVFVQELPKMRINGATRWLKNGRPLIQMTLRHTWEDAIWFSFFHESAHVYLDHAKGDLILDENPDGDGGVLEEEANKLAGEWLLPSKQFQQFAEAGDFKAKSIRDFATKMAVSPGIVVGRLHHDGLLDWEECHHLKRQYTWENWPSVG